MSHRNDMYTLKKRYCAPELHRIRNMLTKQSILPQIFLRSTKFKCDLRVFLNILKKEKKIKILD